LQAETGSDEVYAQVSLVPESEVRFRPDLIACMVFEKMRERRKLFEIPNACDISFVILEIKLSSFFRSELKLSSIVKYNFIIERANDCVG
jgi:hypothetical protein